MAFDKDRRDGIRRVVEVAPRRCVFAALLVMCLVGLIGTPAAFGQTATLAPQQSVASSEPLVVSVRTVADASKQLRVALNKSLIVDTSLPIRRASVTAPDVAEVIVLSPKKLLVTAKTFGETQLILWTADEQQELFDLVVELDLRELEAAVARTSPTADVQFNSLRDTLVISGGVPSAEMAERVMQLASIYAANVQNQLEVYGAQQVILRCIVAEVSKSAMRQLGVNGWLAGDHFQDMFMVSQVGGINPANIGAAASAGVGGTVPFLTGSEGIPMTSSPTFSVGFPAIQMQLFVRALRENGLGRVLAEPTLMAISGETASVLAGGEFPVPVPQGVDQVTIEYKEFGVRMNFTPTVKAGQRISLRVEPEVSQLDFSASVQFSGFVVPGLTQRRASTTIEVGNGQTVAMAGLLNETVQGLSTKLPGLGDLPVLGPLFRSVEYQTRQSELVILVTPELAAPLNPDQVTSTLPGDGMTVPSDHELFSKGQLEGTPIGPKRTAKDDELSQSPVASSAEPGKPAPAWIGTWGFADSEETN